MSGPDFFLPRDRALELVELAGVYLHEGEPAKASERLRQAADLLEQWDKQLEEGAAALIANMRDER